MAATTDLDTASAVLAAAREETLAAEMAEVRRFQRAADWAAMHSVDSIGPAAVWEGELPIAGDGAPLVAEFCVAEFALAIDKSTDAGRAYLGEAVEVRYRLPKTWALVVAGRVPGSWIPTSPPSPLDCRSRNWSGSWRRPGCGSTRSKQKPAGSPPPTAGASTCTPTRSPTTVPSTSSAPSTWPTPWTSTTPSPPARRLADLGCAESLDVRRSLAAGDLARHQGTLELPKRQVVMNVHTDGGPFAKLDNTRSFHSIDQVRDWCGGASVHTRQVIDLNEHRWNQGHDPTPLLREQAT
jgi:hypothetical protein